MVAYGVNISTDHTPPGVASVSVIVCPTHTTLGPNIAAGAGVTFIVFVTVHPEPPSEYVIVAGPADTPHTMPEREPTLATAGLLLDHTPPGTISVNGWQSNIHTADGPMIGPGEGLTFTVIVVKQPVDGIV